MICFVPIGYTSPCNCMQRQGNHIRYAHVSSQPRGPTHELGRGFAAKICPGDRGIKSAFAFLAKLPGNVPMGFANALLS